MRLHQDLFQKWLEMISPPLMKSFTDTEIFLETTIKLEKIILYTPSIHLHLFLHFNRDFLNKSLFFEVTTTPANPKEYFYARDETETNAQTQQATCIANKCDKGNGYVSFDFGDIWTLYHDMNQSQVLPSIFIHLFSQCFIGVFKLFEVV